MELKKTDFDKLQYNVHAIEESADILALFPDLKRFPEFIEPISIIKDGQPLTINKNKILKYVFYCYDKNSPFIYEKNLIRRKILCAQQAGFKVNELGKFNDVIDNILKGNNDIVNRMIIRFVRNQRDLRYSLLTAGLENYYDNINKLTKDGMALKKMMDDLELLELLADEVFNNDRDLIFMADNINEEEHNHIVSYPEYWASLRNKTENE